MTDGVIDATDMYRAALVQSVAALDSYAHDVVLDMAFDILAGSRTPGSASRIGLHFGAVSELISAASPVEFELRARAAINSRLSTETFQKPDDIASAFAMVGVSKIWTAAFGSDAKVAMTDLSVVVRRRNQIVHRCDVDPAGVLGTLPLRASDALDAIATVDRVVRNFDAIL
ncbi:hypothetical protein [Nocardia amikacinitolerans]|nr:hypothetical protein [Nocardia amikacinitolerans]